MSTHLVIRLTELADNPLMWVWANPSISRFDVGTGDYKMLGDLPPADSITLFFPTKWVAFGQYELPTKNPQHAALAARSLIEDGLINDIEDMHVITRLLENNRLEVAAVQYEVLQQALDKFSSYGLMADVAMPDCLVLPYFKDSWSIEAHADELLIRTGPLAGFNYDLSWFNETESGHLTDLFNLPETPPATCKFFHYDNKLSINIDNLMPNVSCEIKPLDSQQELLIDFARNTSPDLHNNFLTGDFEPKKSSRMAWINWRLPVYALAAGLFIFTLIVTATNQIQKSQYDKLREQIASNFKRAFPGIPMAEDVNGSLTLQVSREIAKLQSQSKQHSGAAGLEPLYNILLNIKQQAGISLLHLSYSGGIYTLDLVSSKTNVAQGFVNRINRTSSLQAKMLSAPANAKNSRSRIQIVERGST